MNTHGVNEVSGAVPCPELDAIVGSVQKAQAKMALMSQDQLRSITRSVGLELMRHAFALAEAACEETGMGRATDKYTKNQYAVEIVLDSYLNNCYIGELEEESYAGYQVVGKPVGVILGVVPVTNPTSTVMFKILISLLTGNGIIISPHPKAKKCSVQAAKIALRAAVAAGAPDGIIAWIDEPTTEKSQLLMKHSAINMIIATGGQQMVRAAYASGHAALGVGSGNVPVWVDSTADIEKTVASILQSVTFDNGVVCATERTVVVDRLTKDGLMIEFQKRGAYFLNKDEKQQVSGILLDGDHLNPLLIGKTAEHIAELSDVDVPEGTVALIAEISSIGYGEPFSWETLSPILALFVVDSFKEGVEVCSQVINFGGMGHTAALHIGHDQKEKVAAFTRRLAVTRVIVNSPAAQGAIGALSNFALNPSLTLGCGTMGGGSVSENVGPRNLVNIETIVRRRNNMQWLRTPEILFQYGCFEKALNEKLENKERVLIVTDEGLFLSGAVNPVRNVLNSLGIQLRIFSQVEPDPKFGTVYRGLELMNQFHPDMIIAFGGGSPMDAAKIMWLLYEHPEIDVKHLATTFLDIERRLYEIPTLGAKAGFIAIPTTSGTGSEVTPFAVVTDDESGTKYPLADYALMPTAAIVDPFFVMNMPKRLTAYGGIDALTHALESLVSVCATDFTLPYAKQAIEMLFQYLPQAYNEGSGNKRAREKVHFAATYAGISFGNAFLGICHSLAHKLGAKFHIPHGLANALLIVEVIRFNAVDNPPRMQSFSQYEKYIAKEQYASLMHNSDCSDDDQRVQRLIERIQQLKRCLDIPLAIREVLPNVSEEEFFHTAQELAPEAFQDQCTGANPRIPTVKDLLDIYMQSW